MYEKIEALCRAEGITVTELCRRAKVSRSALSDYKTGRKKSIGLGNLVKISDYFGITLDELLGRSAKGEMERGARPAEELRRGSRARLLSLLRKSSDEELDEIVRLVEALQKSDA